MGSAQAIQISETVCWLDEYKVWYDDLRDRVIQHVQSMDLAYFETLHKQQKPQESQSRPQQAQQGGSQDCP